MPAFVNNKFGASGRSDDDGTMVCCFSRKKSRNDCRICADVMTCRSYAQNAAARADACHGVALAKAGRSERDRETGRDEVIREGGVPADVGAELIRDFDVGEVFISVPFNRDRPGDEERKSSSRGGETRLDVK